MTTQAVPKIAIIGAGLAGCECAHALSVAGIPSTLFEMKPASFSPAHENPDLAELVCSNSFRSDDHGNAIGLLKHEMRSLKSLIMEIAEMTKVPAGKALAVDRTKFSHQVTQKIKNNPLITLVHQEITGLTSKECQALTGFDIIIVTAGPMASETISASLSTLMGAEELYFYDAIAPIISGDSIDMNIAFKGSRYGHEQANGDASDRAENIVEQGDYINCPMDKDEYLALHAALVTAQKAPTKDFEREIHFEGCMPIEALAERGEKTLVFGPLKPVGFIDPRTGRRPYALVQLRAENLNGSMYNLVGCQTKLVHSEQERIFRMIPGLAKVEFMRHGSMHRNTFVNAPKVLNPDLSLVSCPNIYLAGQITGVEGYVESAACGLWLGISLASKIKGARIQDPPETSALGALLRHLRQPAKHFQPSNIQFGLMPELNMKASKNNRKIMYAERTKSAFAEWLAESIKYLSH